MVARAHSKVAFAVKHMGISLAWLPRRGPVPRDHVRVHSDRGARRRPVPLIGRLTIGRVTSELVW